MSTPTVTSRNRTDDLKVLSVAVVKDRLSFSESRLNGHVVDTKDLLVGYVETALGVSNRINWSTETDDELPAIKEWQDYCCDLFDSIQEFTVKSILG